jgi:hypothetical protein
LGFWSNAAASIDACMKQGDVEEWLVALFSLSAFTEVFGGEEVSELSISICTSSL